MIRIIPKDQEFFTLFEKAAQNILDGAEALKDLLDNFDDVREKARRIEEIEHKGDALTHEIVKKLNTSFVTPIDREDIHSLASSLDDVIDLIHASSLRIVITSYSIHYTKLYEARDRVVDHADHTPGLYLRGSGRNGISRNNFV